MDVAMGLDWSMDQGIDPKMLNVNHVMSSMDCHSSYSHSPQEEPLGHIPPSERYLPNVRGSLPLNISPVAYTGPDLEMQMGFGTPMMGLNERPVDKDAFPFNGAIGMATSEPSLPEKGVNENRFRPPPSNIFAATGPLMSWTNQTTSFNDYQVFGGAQPMMAQNFLPNASSWHQQDQESCISFSTMNDVTPQPETPRTSQGLSSQRTSKTPVSKAKLPRLRAGAPRPVHKRSPSLKAFSMTKKTKIGLEGSGNAGSGSNSNRSKALEDLELEDAIELLKKKFQRSPFCSLSQLKADDLLTQLEQIAIDEKKYRPLQSDTTSSTQDSQSNSGLIDLEYTTDDTSVVSSTPRPGVTHDDSASEEVDHTESTQCKTHICDNDCRSKPLFHSTFKGCHYATHSPADWRRHEETTKHWPQQAFMCVYCPAPPTAADHNPRCQFCHASFTTIVGPPTAHYLQCAAAQVHGKIFRRKDKLLDHIRKGHPHILNPSPAAAAGEFQDSTANWPKNCGFCQHVFTSWNERMEHIAEHFQNGAKIADWRLPLPPPKDFRPSGTDSQRRDDDDSDDDNGPHGGSGPSQMKFTGKKVAGAAAFSSQRCQRSSGPVANAPSSSRRRRRGTAEEELLDVTEKQTFDSWGGPRKQSLVLERYLNDPEEPIPTLQTQFSQAPSCAQPRLSSPAAGRQLFTHDMASRNNVMEDRCNIQMDEPNKENEISSWRAITAELTPTRAQVDILTERLEFQKVVHACIVKAQEYKGSECLVVPYSPTKAASSLASMLKAQTDLELILRRPLTAAKQGSSTLKNESNGPIKLAIVGMASRFPDAASHEKLWELLEKGLDVHRVVPKDRFNAETHYDPTRKTKNTSHTPSECWIENPGLFDPRFFNMSPREAFQTDPMQRMALSTAYEALEMSGYVPNRTCSTKLDRIGTFYGQTSDGWREINAAQEVDTYFITGGVRAPGLGRINYHFGFSGTSFNIDTACSSSAAAMQLACTSLVAGDCDTAIVGGLSCMTNSDIFAGLSLGQFLSKKGPCATFDNDADGYCRADGVGTIIVKRLDDALAEKDNILAVIPATATNHSADAISITHPHGGTQEILYKSILDKAGVDVLDIDYVEMHGTKTQARGGTEMKSVTNVFAPADRKRTAEQPLFLGAVKANVGHGGAASGVTALIKVLMMVRKNAIPPHVGTKGTINKGFPKDPSERNGEFSLIQVATHNTLPYAILSHTWTSQEVTYQNLISGAGKSKSGYEKIKFCGEQATRDGLQYFWVDTCCIDKSDPAELSKAINSMFRWYQNAKKCYVYLADVSIPGENADIQTSQSAWEVAFRKSKWFTRGWTLQELIAPAVVEFFSQEGKLLGGKKLLEKPIHEITHIPVQALRGIDTLVALVQGVPGEDRCIILVGYEDKIPDMFHNVNPGLLRRFPIKRPFRFENFNLHQLEQILKLKMREQDIDCTSKALEVARDVLERALMRPNFTNAGEVESCLATAKMNYEMRQSRKHIDDQAVDGELEPEDFDIDFDRGSRTGVNRRKVLEGLVHESIIEKLISYQSRCLGARRNKLNPRDQVPTNFVFKGFPGTGKTTTAKHMGQIFYDMGFLSTAEVVECSATDLLGQYVGQTAPKTRKQLEKALGKVLFIDKAYRLIYGQYAAEALGELIQFLTQPSHVGKMVVILAGYTADMYLLMSIRPVLSRLFPEEILFENLRPEDCITLLLRELE